MSETPRGFRRLAGLSPFNEMVGPLYELRAGEELSIGMRIEKKHTNSLGICHGGVLATLADVALGYAMHAKIETKASYVTAHLAVDYAGAAKVGDWVESRVEIQRVGARLAFANCYLVCGERRLIRASAIFARADKER
jgi:uncharacterized protein (TIGR00369 family)